MTRVKICCISSMEEARLAIKAGADALGLVSEMPSGPGVIDKDTIAEISRMVPPPIATFLLTSKTTVPEIIAQQRACCVNTLQLVEGISPESTYELKQALPGVKLVKVLHVENRDAIDKAKKFESVADALLLDSSTTTLGIKKLGGTGQTHDWSISKEIVDGVKLPVFLAGGLNSENVRAAITAVQPFAVDVCTGVRFNQKLDETRVRTFIKAAKSIF